MVALVCFHVVMTQPIQENSVHHAMRDADNSVIYNECIWNILTQKKTTMAVMRRSATAVFLSALLAIGHADLIIDGGDSGWQTDSWCE